MRSFPTLLVSILLLGATTPAASQLFWIDDLTNSIHRADHDGQNQTTLLTDLGQPQGIAVDRKGNSLYWTDPDFDVRRVSRADLDGANPLEVLFAFAPTGIATDTAAEKIYWIDTALERISRSNYDGSFLEILVSDFVVGHSVALDPTANRLFASNVVDGKIYAGELDGTDFQEIASGPGRPLGIAVDVVTQKIYWVQAGNPYLIKRSNYDGSALETFLDNLPGTFGLAIDQSTGKLYWTENETGKIRRCNLDGSAIEDVITGLDEPIGLALIEERIFDDGFESGSTAPWSITIN